MKLNFITVLSLLILSLGISSNLKAQGRIACVNAAELAEELPEMATALKTFQEFQKQKQVQLETMDTERQKKYALYQDTYKNLSEANRDVLEKQLMTLQKEVEDLTERITDTDEKFRQEIEEKQQSLYEPIMNKVTKAIQAVAKSKGYAYVFDTSQPGLVFSAEADDLQDLVRANLGINLNAGKNPAANE